MAVASMWNCPACGTKGLLATNHQYCPACGLEQDEQARYVPSMAEMANAAEHPYLGRELACLVCHSLNSRASNNCAGCGCSLAGAREMPAPSGSRANMSRSGMSSAGMSRAGMSNAGMSNAGMSSAGMSNAGMSNAGKSRAGMSRAGLSRSGMRASDSLTAEIEAERTLQSDLSRKRAMQISQSVAAGEATRARSRMLLALAVIAIGGLVYVAAQRGLKAPEATAVRHEWQRIIEIEQYREFVENAPCDRAPPNSQLLGPRGGGDMCGYRLTAWEVVREAKREGTRHDSDREWPEYRLRWTGEGDCDGCEREGERRELFLVRFNYGEHSQTCELDRATWKSISVDDSFTVVANQGDEGFDCASLSPS